jgi:hypothetical protein
MTVRADSYGTAVEVFALARYLADSQTAFNSTTRPTLTEVEKFIDRTSGVLNVALWRSGLAPVNVTANSTAKLMMDDWVVERALTWVEASQRAGVGGDENERKGPALHEQASLFIGGMALGLKRLGITVSDPDHQGLTYTGLDKHSERTDPDDTSREQPKFLRGLFDSDSQDSGED